MILDVWVLAWAALLLLLFGLIWAAYRRAPQLELSREVPPAGFVGRDVGCRIHIKLSSRLPLRYVIEDAPPLTIIADRQWRWAGWLWQSGEAELSGSLHLNARGEYHWPATTLRWADPFGLFWRSTRLRFGTRMEVYPGIHGLALPDLLRPLLSEGALSRTLGLDDPLSLRGARPYSPGDPPSRIHWRLSARTGELTVRELERTASSRLLVFVDTRGDDVFLESAVRLSASLISEALKSELPISLSTPQGATPPGRTPLALQAALSKLATLQAQPAETALPDLSEQAAGSNVIVLTQHAPSDVLTAALRARTRAKRVVIVVMPEGFYLEPGESPRRQWVGLSSTVRDLERRAGVLADAGVLVYVLRGNQSVLRLA
ncbi:DUF58 domain-containing protein [Deinococcus detaillensis]|uniref:DUF58 domain-containing protein n=1 Tax=Deinococcus detaillensis TaxID=2592048 RepID=A0A553UW77_9DEIO|nr:DUF58 domain-containing protein [Deinococcus detaillensis]TSA84460.1 DUF58 domain-containing protein [Deinococcus detaillensis]